MNLTIQSSWFEIEDAALYLSRHLGQTVSETNIYQLAINRQLRIAVKIISSVSSLVESKINEHDTPTTSYSAQESYRVLSGTRWYLSNTDSTTQLLEFLEKYSRKFEFASMINEPIILEALDGKSYAHLIYLIRSGLEVHIGRSKTLPEDYLLEVSREELDSFIEKHNASEETAKPISTANNDSLLLLVGALSVALSETDDNLKRAGKPNASKIRDHLVETVFGVDPLTGKHPRGLGASKVSNNIRNGLNYLDSIDFSEIDANELFEAIKVATINIEGKEN